jgi:hypothetical protein
MGGIDGQPENHADYLKIPISEATPTDYEQSCWSMSNIWDNTPLSAVIDGVRWLLWEENGKLVRIIAPRQDHIGPPGSFGHVTTK